MAGKSVLYLILHGDDYDNLRNLAVAGIILQALYLTKLAAGNRQIAEKSIWFDFWIINLLYGARSQ